MKLCDFLNKIICDTRFLIDMPPEEELNKEGERPKKYRAEYFGDVLEQQEGMFGSIATITNFFMNFLDETDILVHLLIVFRRLYNFFPKFRPYL